MPCRVAAAPFLDCLPLVDWLSRCPAPEVELSQALPSRLSELLHADRADVALLPVVEYFRGRGAEMVAGIGIAASSAISSVKLFTRCSPETIDRVSVDRGSQTSVALLRILLAELYGVRPDFYAVKPICETLFEDAEAALIVGDRCFEVDRFLRQKRIEGVQALDLGDLWHQLTGLPFVLVCWVLGRAYTARSSRTERESLVSLLTKARDHGLANLDTLAERETVKGRLGPGGETDSAVLRRHFLESLRYKLDEKDMAGMRRFYDLCVAHTICPAGRAPQLAAEGTG